MWVGVGKPREQEKEKGATGGGEERERDREREIERRVLWGVGWSKSRRGGVGRGWCQGRF